MRSGVCPAVGSLQSGEQLIERPVGDGPDFIPLDALIGSVERDPDARMIIPPGAGIDLQAARSEGLLEALPAVRADAQAEAAEDAHHGAVSVVQEVARGLGRRASVVERHRGAEAPGDTDELDVRLWSGLLRVGG